MALGAAMPVDHCGVWHAGRGRAGLGTHLDGRLAPRPPERRHRDMGFWLGSKKSFWGGTTTILMDNTIDLSYDPVLHSKTKHIARRDLFIREPDFLSELRERYTPSPSRSCL